MTPTHWTHVSTDPNSGDARGYRIKAVKAAARPPVPDRVAFLADAARGKRVLDLGVVNHTVDSTVTAGWLHERIRGAAAECLGVDVLAPAVEQLRGRGYNVRVFDVTSGERLGQHFDLIVAGELVEHLGAPQALFEFAATHLAPGGQLILSTPHPYYLTRVLQFARGREHESADHVALYFPSAVAELAERAGLRLAEWRGVAVPLRWKGRALRALLRGLGWAPDLLCDTLVYTCTPAEPRS